jgi:hypothetical protein
MKKTSELYVRYSAGPNEEFFKLPKQVQWRKKRVCDKAGWQYRMAMEPGYRNGWKFGPVRQQQQGKITALLQGSHSHICTRTNGPG